MKKKKAKPPRKAPRTHRPKSDADGDKYVLRLYVTGTTPKSVRAISNLTRLCDELLDGKVDLKVIDIYQQPALAGEQQIIAAPTLVKSLPLPLRRVIGDLSDRGRVMIGLNLASDETT